MGKNNVFILTKILLAAFFAVFFFYPLILAAAKSVELNGKNFPNYIGIVASNAGLFWNSFFQAAVSTIFSLMLGIPFAFILARRDFAGKKAVKALAMVPFVMPPILVVISFIIIFGNNGWINQLLQKYFGFFGPIQFLYGFGGIIIAHVFFNFPLVARFVSTAWENIDQSMEEAAKTLGANKHMEFFNIALPQLMPAILASASIVFIYSFTSFAIVLGLGSFDFSTVEVEIFRQISRNQNFSAAATLAAAQFFMLAIVSFGYLHFSKKFEITQKNAPQKPKKISTKNFSGACEAVFLALCVFFILLPVFSLAFFALGGPAGKISLNAFEKIFFPKNASLAGTTPLSSVAFSLIIAIIASVTATLLGLAAGLKQTRIPLIDFFAGASIAVSTITLGIGYYIGLGAGNLLVIAIGHSVLAFPFSLRLIGNAVKKASDESIESARTLGAGEIGALGLVLLPQIKNSIFASLAFCFAVSLGELGLVLMLYNGAFPTMPVYVYRLLSTFDLFGAAAMGMLLATASFFAFFAIEHFSKNQQVF